MDYKDGIDLKYIKEVRPKNYEQKESDKYSYFLYAFLKKYRNLRVVKVFCNSSEKICFTAKVYKDGVADFAFLTNILCGLNKSINKGFIFCEVIKDITDEFYTEYLHKGRCYLHGHMPLMYDDGRYTYTEIGRKCNWCGKEFKKEIKRKVKVEEEVVFKEIGERLA